MTNNCRGYDPRFGDLLSCNGPLTTPYFGEQASQPDTSSSFHSKCQYQTFESHPNCNLVPIDYGISPGVRNDPWQNRDDYSVLMENFDTAGSRRLPMNWSKGRGEHESYQAGLVPNEQTHIYPSAGNMQPAQYHDEGLWHCGQQNIPSSSSLEVFREPTVDGGYSSETWMHHSQNFSPSLSSSVPHAASSSNATSYPNCSTFRGSHSISTTDFNGPNNQVEEAPNEHERSIAKRERALSERERALTERERVLAERETALDERERVLDAMEELQIRHGRNSSTTGDIIEGKVAHMTSTELEELVNNSGRSLQRSSKFDLGLIKQIIDLTKNMSTHSLRNLILADSRLRNVSTTLCNEAAERKPLDKLLRALGSDLRKWEILFDRHPNMQIFFESLKSGKTRIPIPKSGNRSELRKNALKSKRIARGRRAINQMFEERDEGEGDGEISEHESDEQKTVKHQVVNNWIQSL